ncbi:TIGR02587 family membrane protein [Arenibaculum sp.]|uniref:TIGR02587 family membrane protein n=1 Tax=Arenibaculum sp. TaxID=2865862 RepID=UPI002E0E8452|nr:TIGR02587 family membrane protein [Arenibaculum sp.]
MTATRPRHEQAGHRAFFVGLARAFAGALIFALPMLMTMEMWWIGFYIDPWKLILLLVVLVPLLVGLGVVSGFKPTEGLRDMVADAFVAITIAVVMSAVVLFVLDVVTLDMPPREVVGKIALQTFPGSVGAMLARAQTGDRRQTRDERREEANYPGALFLMAVGALFLGLNIAPTEEIVLLSYMMEPPREIALAALSLALMHGFVFAVEFPGSPPRRPGATFMGLFLRYTVVGYTIVLAICLYLLWTFGRMEGTGGAELASACVVLGFPCSIGAAAARLIV